MGEVRVVGIRVEQPQNQPVLLLRESNGDRYLPIWIGQSEAAAIALEQQGVEPARPLTHDLIRDVIAALGHSLKEVRIVDLQEGTFYADLVFDQDITVSARPSDSVAIALRMGVPIYVEEAVLAEAGLLIPDESDEEASGTVREDEVEKFKEFLDSVSPAGARLTTMELRYARIIHAEFMAHRTFCLAGDSELEFDLPGGATKGYRRVCRMRIDEFVDKWVNGARRVGSKPKRECDLSWVEPARTYPAAEVAMLAQPSEPPPAKPAPKPPKAAAKH